MGKRGRKPVPTAIKMARGTYRPDRAPTNEATPIGKPTIPTWINDHDVKKEFNRVTKTLSAMGLVGASDTNTITRYAITWLRWRRIVQTLTANPSAEIQVYRDDKGAVKAMQVSALHSVARSLAAELSQMENALGMTPSARSRIEVNIPAATSPAESKSRFFNNELRLAK